MPELPEVETIRRGLISTVIGKTITDVTVRKEKMVRGSVADFQSMLTDNSVKDIERRGKLLMFSFVEGDHVLLAHLKMTGQLIYRDSHITVAGGHPWPQVDAALPNKYSHIIFTFEDGSHLYFNDQRQFGFMRLVTPEEKAAVVATYGVDPVVDEFSLDQFITALSGRRISVKAVLLDQTRIAGIGNIYADEACFLAAIHPSRPAYTLQPQEIERLHQAVDDVITKAITQGGTTFKDYRDAEGGKGNFTEHLAVYGRTNEPCVRCKAPIHKLKIAGRGTHVCLTCQPLERVAL